METHTSTPLGNGNTKTYSHVPRILMHCTRKKYQTSFCFCLNISHSKSRRKKNCRTSFYSFAVSANDDAYVERSIVRMFVRTSVRFGLPDSILLCSVHSIWHVKYGVYHSLSRFFCSPCILCHQTLAYISL